jgi:hypothetical protein
MAVMVPVLVTDAAVCELVSVLAAVEAAVVEQLMAVGTVTPWVPQKLTAKLMAVCWSAASHADARQHAMSLRNEDWEQIHFALICGHPPILDPIQRDGGSANSPIRDGVSFWAWLTGVATAKTDGFSGTAPRKKNMELKLLTRCKFGHTGCLLLRNQSS